MILLLSMAASVPAQSPVPPPAPETPLRPAAELDQLLGPIALYPDPLIAEILPASTFPSEIVMADRYVSEGSDPNEIPSQGWDPSVQALAHYAAVLKWMDDNLPWTTQLGQAFQNQQSDVMDSIQRPLRRKPWPVTTGTSKLNPPIQTICTCPFIRRTQYTIRTAFIAHLAPNCPLVSGWRMIGIGTVEV